MNSLIILDFDEPLDTINVLAGIEVDASGEPVPSSIALSNGNRRATFTSAFPLPPNTLHTLTVTTQVTDLVGNPLNNPGSSSFQTGETGDVVDPTVIEVDPPSGASNVPITAMAAIIFSEWVNPLSVSDNFYIERTSTQTMVPGTVAVAVDGLSATFTPKPPLDPSTNYRVRTLSGITDVAGNGLGSTSVPSAFTTGVGDDTVAPTIVTASPPSGTTGVPVNARVVVRVSEPVSALSVDDTTVGVFVGGVPVAGTVSVDSSHTTLTFTPTESLATNTVYSVHVASFTDLGGKPLVPFSSNFSTGGSAVADTDVPQVTSVSPADGDVNVDVNTNIVVTFSEVIDPTTASTSSISVGIEGLSGDVAGTYTVNGAVVTFTPTTPFPGSVPVFVLVSSNRVKDLAGNSNQFFFSSFNTPDIAADVTAPAVVSMTPVDGATDVGPNAKVVLTFSESLNPNTINSDTFALFANGDRLFPFISRSADNRVVTLIPTLPAESVVHVVAGEVQDLSGNDLSEFMSSFTTAASFDSGRAMERRECR